MFVHFSKPAPKTLADYTTASLIVPELRSYTPSAVLAELCLLLRRQGCLHDATAFYDAVLAREVLSPTCTSAGWAMPHARLKDLPRFCFSLARVAPPVPWLGYSGPPVKLILLFAVPEQEAKSYLNLIAGVARLSQNSALVEQLQGAPDPAGILHVLQQVPLPDLRTPQAIASPPDAGPFAALRLNPRS